MEIRIGTRKSPLALAQAELVRAALVAAHPGLEVSVHTFTTTGDRMLSGPLAEVGGKGLFTKELEEALFARAIDVAVHSAKDMQTTLPEGLLLAATLPREDARDVLIGAESIGALPMGARLGTASLRRAAQVLARRPDVQVVPLRGNVGTRLEKIQRGEADATLLALAGLKRLGMSPLPGVPLSVEDMLPAVAQGAVALECREDDASTRARLSAVNHAATLAAITAERAMLKVLDGSCRTPIAGYAHIIPSPAPAFAPLSATDALFQGGAKVRQDGGGLGRGEESETLHLTGLVLAPDGSAFKRVDIKGPVADAEALGVEAGERLKSCG